MQYQQKFKNGLSTPCTILSNHTGHYTGQMYCAEKALEALNRTLGDMRRNDQLFGGTRILLSGDYRQILPVLCLKSSVLWCHV